MKYIKNFLDFIPLVKLYPLWAQITIFLLVLFICLILFFVPRKIPPASEKEKEENLDISLKIHEIRSGGGVTYSKEWDEIIIDVVNIGNISMYLEKAEFYCNDKLIAISSLKQVKTEKKDQNITEYEEYYVKLDPGMKWDDISPPFYIKNTEKYINLGDYIGKLEFKIKTTRGKWFSKSIIKNTKP